ncbi:hypothetical protein FF125_06915 [Aureibaculum algae]|uniref:Uncharacterized protein n=1 Tax=Aureibaculum algae TaxID=2584122 RepID=A0A5B7TSK5_9FLAO|nr:hypothetical protein [Aureibaculum algae]QCX38173.1 hypothetical protein FF125_06915 [Aureibaculum algae]
MNKLEKLTIADLKSGKDYVEKLKLERLDYLKNTDIDSNDDIGFQQLDKLDFDLHNQLFARLMKLRTN